MPSEQKKTLMELSANKSTEVLLGGVSTLASSLNFCLKKKLGNFQGIEETEDTVVKIYHFQWKSAERILNYLSH